MVQNFVFKRTNELSPEEKTQFLSLFAHTFPRTISREEFHRKYSCTPLGYSHHGLMVVDGTLAGAYNLIPYAYNCFGDRRLFGLSVDAMVAPDTGAGPSIWPAWAQWPTKEPNATASVSCSVFRTTTRTG